MIKTESKTPVQILAERQLKIISDLRSTAWMGKKAEDPSYYDLVECIQTIRQTAIAALLQQRPENE